MNSATLPGTDQQNQVKMLPPYKVILHNDDVNSAPDVVRRIMEFVHLDKLEAENKTLEAHQEGQSVLIITHKERAELIMDQFSGCVPHIIVTIEADN